MSGCEKGTEGCVCGRGKRSLSAYVVHPAPPRHHPETAVAAFPQYKRQSVTGRVLEGGGTVQGAKPTFQ
ncbi:hypothetical protein BaRGS_00011517 [Batillaria attramentaria]|uniref:Uncharacterized protein n=1 Tax=Batillaria attramentaria TaxID=370345 RepID=A0ABD0LD94_9CAEN